jgi:nucleotide-binding universal stress UspA family protein
MHVLIATTGALSPDPAVAFTSHLLGDNGRVSVTTVIEVPRSFLDQLRDEGWHPLGTSVDGDGPVEAEDDAVIGRYVEERGRRLTEPVTSALRAAGIEAEEIFLEGADPAVSISELADKIEADVVVLGTTRQIFDQSAWESVSARVMIESGRPVLVVPPARKESADANGIEN